MSGLLGFPGARSSGMNQKAPSQVQPTSSGWEVGRGSFDSQTKMMLHGDGSHGMQPTQWIPACTVQLMSHGCLLLSQKKDKVPFQVNAPISINGVIKKNV